MSVERRQQERKVLSLKAELVSGKRRYSCFIKNLTAAGAYIETVPSSVPMVLSPRAKVELTFQTASGKVLNLPGVVKWSSADKATTRCTNCLGIEILVQSSGLKEFLKTLL